MTGEARRAELRLPIPRVVNLGVELFADALRAHGVDVVHVAWRPPGGGDPELLAALAHLEANRERVDDANQRALGRLVAGDPILVDCRPAREALGLPAHTVLHAGPPLNWERAGEPMRAAILCALRYEGWARDDDEAAALVARGEVRLEPCHDWRAVGPMTGIVTPSMPVLVVEDAVHRTRGHATLNEGLGKVLRFGANDARVVARLHWLAEEAGPLLGAAVRATGGLPLRPLMALALRMGDELHQRNVAASALLVRALLAPLVEVAGSTTGLTRLAQFLASNDQFFLNIAMAAAKAMADAAQGEPGSSLVTAMARNGTEFGIRVSGLGDRWFTAPAPRPRGLYFPGYSEDDGHPDLGDSAIVETVGLGAVAMAAAPAAARFVGVGGGAAALAVTREMDEITLTEHPHFRIPALDERGTPTGFDVRLVVDTGITPLINTGIAGRRAGTGQIGAGTVRAPLTCFAAALRALAATL